MTRDIHKYANFLEYRTETPVSYRNRKFKVKSNIILGSEIDSRPPQINFHANR